MKSNTLNFFAVALIILSFVVFFKGSGSQSTTQPQFQVPTVPLSEVAEKTTTNDDLDHQADCAKQAHANFINGKYDKNESASYTNHFNTKLQKCFILLTLPDYAKGDFLETLEDANENVVYVDFWQDINTDAMLSNDCTDSPCKLTKDNSAEALIQSYMKE